MKVGDKQIITAFGRTFEAEIRYVENDIVHVVLKPKVAQQPAIASKVEDNESSTPPSLSSDIAWRCVWCANEVHGNFWKTHGFSKCPAPFWFKLSKVLRHPISVLRFQSEWVEVPLVQVG